LIVSCCSAAAPAAYQFDANDFAVEVIDYVEGDSIPLDWFTESPFNEPNTALGRPTIDTTGDAWKIPLLTKVPVVSVYSAFRSFEVVSIGFGGRLVLKFSHRVCDDKNNPYGMDFIIFGNAQQNVAGDGYNGDPNALLNDTNNLIAEPGIVRVSQTGNINDANEWYEFTTGPYADTWAPTFGRIYDPCEPNASIGSWNHWWSSPTNPTLPVDPNFCADGFTGRSVAYMSLAYGESAGGTAFDLQQLDPCDFNALATDPETGRKWIQYVWIEPKEDFSTEIDAVSDVACCGDYKHPPPLGDIDDNCIVDEYDLLLLAEYWLDDNIGPNSPGIEADLYLSGKIDFRDLAVLAADWKVCTFNCGQ